jgi:hypothetical protein
LFVGAEPLPIGKCAVALLRVLIEQPSAPIAKDALTEAAWPGLAVEESNLTMQLAACGTPGPIIPKLVNYCPQSIGGSRKVSTPLI